jgi:hypothetical protein
MKRFIPPLLLVLTACAPFAGLAPSPTPDLQVLRSNAPLLLLNVADLPSEGKYLLPVPSGSGELDNQAVLDAWGADEGGKYISETGRVDGWWIQFNRTADGDAVPSQVYDSIVLYQTSAGARLSVRTYSGHGMQDYSEVPGMPQVGDSARAFVLREGGSVDYVLCFSYRNFQHVVEILGSESEATPAFAVGIAQALLQKLRSAPLSSTGG